MSNILTRPEEGKRYINFNNQRLVQNIDSHKLNAGKASILAIMAGFSNEDGSSIFPSLAVVAYISKSGKSTVSRIINQLVKDEFLILVKQTDNITPSEYKLNTPLIRSLQGNISELMKSNNDKKASSQPIEGHPNLSIPPSNGGVPLQEGMLKSSIPPPEFDTVILSGILDSSIGVYSNRGEGGVPPVHNFTEPLYEQGVPVGGVCSNRGEGMLKSRGGVCSNREHNIQINNTIKNTTAAVRAHEGQSGPVAAAVFFNKLLEPGSQQTNGSMLTASEPPNTNAKQQTHVTIQADVISHTNGSTAADLTFAASFAVKPAVSQASTEPISRQGLTKHPLEPDNPDTMNFCRVIPETPENKAAEHQKLLAYFLMQLDNKISLEQLEAFIVEFGLTKVDQACEFLENRGIANIRSVGGFLRKALEEGYYDKKTSPWPQMVPSSHINGPYSASQMPGGAKSYDSRVSNRNDIDDLRDKANWSLEQNQIWYRSLPAEIKASARAEVLYKWSAFQYLCDDQGCDMASDVFVSHRLFKQFAEVANELRFEKAAHRFRSRID